MSLRSLVVAWSAFPRTVQTLGPNGLPDVATHSLPATLDSGCCQSIVRLVSRGQQHWQASLLYSNGDYENVSLAVAAENAVSKQASPQNGGRVLDTLRAGRRWLAAAMLPCVNARGQPRTNAHESTHTRTRARTHTHSLTHAHTHSLTHTRTHARTHAYARTHARPHRKRVDDLSPWWLVVFMSFPVR
jgi:hypothetical protein